MTDLRLWEDDEEESYEDEEGEQDESDEEKRVILFTINRSQPILSF